MPELPEVETVVRTLRPILRGGRIARAILHRQDIVTPPMPDLPERLQGRLINDLRRRGKRIIIALDDGNAFYVHLGMSGRLTIESEESPILRHTHFIMKVARASVDRATLSPTDVRGLVEIRFRDPRRFGGLWWLGNAATDSGMGPEPLTLTTKVLMQKLQNTTRAIKSALLDQAVVAGLGNIYVDESLFAAGIHPLTVSNELSYLQVALLNRSIKTVLRKAIHHRGSTLRDYRDAHGESGGFQIQHQVYARTKMPCRVCKTEVLRIVLGGRSTHFCPSCQPKSTTRKSK